MKTLNQFLTQIDENVNPAYEFYHEAEKIRGGKLSTDDTVSFPKGHKHVKELLTKYPKARLVGSWDGRDHLDHLVGLNEGIKEKIKGIVRREKAKDMPLVQTRTDYAVGKAADKYEAGDTKNGNRYMAWAERDRKKRGAPTTNPAGTYRTKTSDYQSEETIDESRVDIELKPHKNGTHYIVSKIHPASGIQPDQLRVGEKLNDSHIDDLNDLGYKVKHIE